MRGLLYSHPDCLEHDPRVFIPGHPDTPERLVELERALAARDWLGWERRGAPAASERQLELAHSAGLVSGLARLCEQGGGIIDPDTAVVEASFAAATRAAGAVCALAEALLGGEAEVGFCAVRPAGHHAESTRAMGFCLFNNVAVAAAYALAELGLERVFVLDWDVHHGNGTGEIFASRSDVLFASIHQSPLYPGTGPLSECGHGEGEGFTINLPVPPGSGEALWLALLERVILPAAAAYEPQLILVSAGFDAHELDPLAECRLQASSFATMAARVRDLAAPRGVGIAAVLEGGYHPAVLAECVCETLPALAGEPEQPAQARPAPQLSHGEQGLVQAAIAQLGRYWPL